MDGVIAGVPAPDREIESAGKCDRPVNDDNLLVLGRTERKAGVETETKPLQCARRELRRGIPLAFRGIEGREIPAQDVDAEIGLRLQQRLEKRTEFFRKTIIGMAGRPDKAGLAVDVPADDIDMVCCEKQSRAQGGKIGARVVQDGQPSRLAPSPDGVAGREDG